MKETRASILLFLSLILFVFSLVILSFWGYHRFFKHPNDSNNSTAPVINIGTVNNDPDIITRRDSLVNEYNETIKKLGKKIDSSISYADSLQIPMNAQMEEYARLKKEVANLLTEKDRLKDLDLAKAKIEELQIKVNDLLSKYDMVEAENKRLVTVIAQLTPKNEIPARQTETVPVIPTSFDTNNTEVAKPAKLPRFGFFSVYDLRLSAWTITDNKELETYKAYQADKFIGSFIVKNPNPPANNNIEMLVVITAPDGHVLQKSPWESGTFETVNGNKMIYSMKINFDYTKGEPKKILFSIAEEDFQPGAYVMQIFQNGAFLGKTTKVLN